MLRQCCIRVLTSSYACPWSACILAFHVTGSMVSASANTGSNCRLGVTIWPCEPWPP
ncbi:hypothetical protein VFPPC_15290 [Pochonia chlamydosporia 170]|uniref:Uncharacterized protein n=1 Tax=Pochonia chlamydosporia 170 TaxID=1380566 RepID=A0A179G698_METCM|nr:hypothetical protein VFPPC_15290 [Pochonia chlamydosporia 170]OAQ73346.1 hypothetical protein VFPPC_15290 [Pochonia chlamydosporia 170]